MTSSPCSQQLTNQIWTRICIPTVFLFCHGMLTWLRQAFRPRIRNIYAGAASTNIWLAYAHLNNVFVHNFFLNEKIPKKVLTGDRELASKPLDLAIYIYRRLYAYMYIYIYRERERELQIDFVSVSIDGSKVPPRGLRACTWKWAYIPGPTQISPVRPAVRLMRWRHVGMYAYAQNLNSRRTNAKHELIISFAHPPNRTVLFGPSRKSCVFFVNLVLRS